MAQGSESRDCDRSPCSLVCDLDNAEEMARGGEFMHRPVELAAAMGGTGRAKYLEAELGAEAFAAMRAVKAYPAEDLESCKDIAGGMSRRRQS